VSERPILFSGPMVRAILEGRKTQTRRVLKPSAYLRRYNDERRLNLSGAQLLDAEAHAARVNIGQGLPSPYGAPGDTLWVRETWCRKITSDGEFFGGYHYAADGEEVFAADGDGYLEVTKRGEFRSPWRPSIHMPRDASRLSLRIKSVRVERLQEISEEDAQAEGLSGPMIDAEMDAIVNQIGLAPSKAFRALWESLNAKSHPWASNPWVWVVEFERVAQEAPRE
jgi:hypothetical protein